MEPVTLLSHAKVNLYLKILGRRADGFHELETVMAALSLADELRFESRPHGVTLECNLAGVPTDDTNLAVRAAKVLQAEFGVAHGVHIVLCKQTPMGGGMGGGSSNGAATLTGLNRLWNLGASTDRLRALAATLGSDVPFFIEPTVAVCRGRGEVIEPIPPDRCRALRGAGVVLLNPGFGVPTPWAYQSFAARGGAAAEAPRDVKPFLDALAGNDARSLAAHLTNSLEAPVFHKYPVLEMLKHSLLEAGAIGAMMSGSGATVFGLCENVAHAESVRSNITARYGASLWTHVATFASHPS